MFRKKLLKVFMLCCNVLQNSFFMIWQSPNIWNNVYNYVAVELVVVLWSTFQINLHFILFYFKSNYSLSLKQNYNFLEVFYFDIKFKMLHFVINNLNISTIFLCVLPQRYYNIGSISFGEQRAKCQLGHYATSTDCNIGHTTAN